MKILNVFKKKENEKKQQQSYQQNELNQQIRCFLLNQSN